MYFIQYSMLSINVMWLIVYVFKNRNLSHEVDSLVKLVQIEREKLNKETRRYEEILQNQQNRNYQNIEFAINERVDHVMSVCQNISYDTSIWTKNHGTNFLDVPSKNLLVAIVPKVGCTNWKRVIMFLEKKITADQRSIALEKGILDQSIHIYFKSA